MAVAWLAGASGLVGGALLRRLLAEGASQAVVSVGRRTLPFADPRLRQAVVDFADPRALETLPPADVAFSCLGTTIAKAGSRPAFRAVDHDAVMSFARAARARGARTFVHVTALGADPGSRVFYNRVKGEVERSVAGLGFESTYALRPSLLDGERPEHRLGERAALVVGRLLGPVLGKYRPTPADVVAATMVAVGLSPAPGAHVVEPGAMRWDAVARDR